MLERIKLKGILKYTLIFLYFFICLLFIYTLSRGDSYVNFGFSYAISKVEIPYVDFNLVILPFAPFLYSIFLIFSKSIICYYLGQAFLLTLFSRIVFKILGNKTWLYFVIFLMPFPIAFSSVIFPGYNFLLLFLVTIILYLEKENKSDYVIGVLLGLAFITKQTVGGLLFLTSFYYLFSDFKKILKRFLGFLGPIFICFLYLYFSHSLKSCIDLCFLGLFDFGHNNFCYEKFYLVCFILTFIVLIFRIIKRPKDISNYYLLVFSSCVYPLIDYYHVSLFLALFLLVFLQDLSFQIDISKYAIVFIVSVGIVWLFIQAKSMNEFEIINYNNFSLSVFSKNYVSNVKKLDSFVSSQEKEVIYFLRGSENYFFKIKNNLDITYFDLSNYGNYGYNGTEKIIDRISSIQDSYIIIDRECYQKDNLFQQYNKEAVKFIINNSSFVKKIGNYEIYYKE